MATNNEVRRTIKIKNSTYLAIRRRGLMGETFDDVLQRILKVEKVKDESPAKYADKIR